MIPSKQVKLFDCQKIDPAAKAELFKYTSNHHINYGNDICIEFDLTEWHHMGEAIFREEYPEPLANLFAYFGNELDGQSSIVIRHWW